MSSAEAHDAGVNYRRLNVDPVIKILAGMYLASSLYTLGQGVSDALDLSNPHPVTIEHSLHEWPVPHTHPTPMEKGLAGIALYSLAALGVSVRNSISYNRAVSEYERQRGPFNQL